MPLEDARRLDPRARLIATVGFVIAVALVPPGSWRCVAALAVALAAATVASGVSPWKLATRWLAFAPAVVFLAVLAAGRSASASGLSWRLAVLDLMVRNSLALTAMMTMAHASSWAETLSALRRLGLPSTLTATLAFMHRYLFVLRDELHRMLTARRARSFGRRRPGFASLAGLIGVLLGRAFDRESRVFSAMTARGWDGSLRTLDD